MTPGRWQLGYLIPRLLLLVVAADLGLRLLPVDGLTFRAWETMARYRPPGAPFEESRLYERTATYGDLAAIGNLPQLRQYRRERFTTDSLGFRNDPGLESCPLGAILIGDSFTVGSGVNDDETLPVRLGSRLGCGVYNAGGIDPHPDRILALARKLGLERGLVIHEYNEDFEMPDRPSEGKRRLQGAIASIGPVAGELIARARGLAAVSPLQIVCERGVKRLEDGRLLPNPHAAKVVRGTLSTGDPILFLAAQVDRFYQAREPPLAYWRWLEGELKRGGLELAVVLVPGKYRVYRRFLIDPRRPPDPPSDYLDRAGDELRRAGIPALDLTPALAEHAARGLAERTYLYWLDDIHWNQEGIEVAAATIQDRLRDRLRCPSADRRGQRSGFTASRTTWISSMPPTR